MADSPTSYLLTNLDFEYDWLEGESYTPSEATLERNQAWSSILRLNPKYTNCELFSSVDTLKGATLIPWGVSPSVLRAAQVHSLRLDSPLPEVVCEVNDKCFSHRLEQDLGIAMPYSRIVGSLSLLESAINTCPFDWVLKHPWGVSGRNRMVGRAGVFTDPMRRWALQQLRSGVELVFEPWADDKVDFSLHFEIERDGEYRRIGATQLLTDPSGNFRGNLVSPEWEPPRGSWEAGERVAQRLADAGYWGPVGLDALTGILGQKKILRPLVEINARFSFGRLSLDMLHWIPPGWSVFWWHPSQRDWQEFNSIAEILEPISPALKNEGAYLLPHPADPTAKTNSLLWVASSCKRLYELIQPIS